MLSGISMNELLRVLESQKDMRALNSSPAFRFCSHCSDRHDENANTVPDEAARALDAIVSYACDHEHAFYGRRRIPPSEGWMGFWPDGDWRFIAFLPSELKRVLEELGFEPDTVIQEWYERGWMVTDNERKRKTKLVRIGQKIVRTYAISRVAIQELKTKKAQKPRFDDHERISFEELATVCHFFSLLFKKLSCCCEKREER